MQKTALILLKVFIALQLSLLLSACPKPIGGSGLGQMTSCNSTGAKSYACLGNSGALVTPNVSLSVSPASVGDNDATNIVYTVTLDQPTGRDTSVNFGTSGTAAPGTDFSAVTSPLVIPAGRTTGTIEIVPMASVRAKDDRFVTITLYSGSGYNTLISEFRL